MAGWSYDGNRVFNGSAPTSWTTLDLKAIAGGGATSHPSATTMALLKIENSAGNPYIAFRLDGSVSNTYIPQVDGHGSLVVHPDSATNDAVLVFVNTSASGQVAWQAATASAMEVWLIGFVEFAGTGSFIQAHPATVPNTWTDLDLTIDTSLAPTGLTAEALAMLLYQSTGGTPDELATRPKGGAANFLSPNGFGACSQGGPTATNEVEYYICKTDAAGLIQHRSESTAPSTQVNLLAFEQDKFLDYDVEVFAAAAPPSTWTSIDLSAYTYSKRGLALLQVHHANTSPGAIINVAFRADDDSSDYLVGSDIYPQGVACSGLDADERTLHLVPTGPTGGIEWSALLTFRNIDVRLLGVVHLSDTPTISNNSPTGTVDARTSISFDVTNNGDFSIDSNTIDLSFTPPGPFPTYDIVINGIFQAPFTGAITPITNGYRVLANEIVIPATGVTALSAYAENSIGESDTLNWNATITANDTPAIVSRNVEGPVLDLDTIRFEIYDPYSLSTTSLEIRMVDAFGVSQTVYDGFAFVGDWGGYVSTSGSPPGFSLVNRISVVIDSWPDAFEASSPAKWTIEVDATNTFGGTL